MRAENSTEPVDNNGNPKANQEALSLTRSPHIQLRLHTPKGRGVFSAGTILAGTIVETCPVLVLSPTENAQHVAKTSLYHYTYNWPIRGSKGSDSGKATQTTQAVIFGVGSMFNHSKHEQNVGWTRDVENQLVVYRALRDIRAGEELCISYGDRLTFEDADGDRADGQMTESESEDQVLYNIQLDA